MVAASFDTAEKRFEIAQRALYDNILRCGESGNDVKGEKMIIYYIYNIIVMDEVPNRRLTDTQRVNKIKVISMSRVFYRVTSLTNMRSF